MPKQHATGPNRADQSSGAGSPLSQSRLQEDVEALAALDRRTTTEGERRSARWIAERLNQMGAHETRVHTTRGPSSWGPVALAYTAAGLLLAQSRAFRSRVLAAGLAVSYELDTSGRSQWARKILPRSEVPTVSARVPASGSVRQTLIVQAHHDAAHGGIVWHPAVIAGSKAWSARTGNSVPTHLPLLFALAGAAFPSRLVRRIATLLLLLTAGGAVQSMRTPTAPGANDNASGVAATLDLVRQLLDKPLPHTDVVVVFPGGEECGNTGARAWMEVNAQRFVPDRTLLVNLDAIGSGGHLVVSRREGLSARYADADIALAHHAADQVGVELRTVGFANVSDAYSAYRSGIRTISLLSYADGWITDLHQRSDTPRNVSWNTVDDAISLTLAVHDRWCEELDSPTLRH